MLQKERNTTLLSCRILSHSPAQAMQIFLAWRQMDDRIGALSHCIESFLWGDARARHTYLIAATDDHLPVVLEIDVGDRKRAIRKTMQLNIVELRHLPTRLSKIELIGVSPSVDALDQLIQAAQRYVGEHPNYHVLFNNCRTFVEYVIDQIPDLSHCIPRQRGSILEFYHTRAKVEHPGMLKKLQRFRRIIRDLYRLTVFWERGNRYLSDTFVQHLLNKRASTDQLFTLSLRPTERVRASCYPQVCLCDGFLSRVWNGQLNILIFFARGWCDPSDVDWCLASLSFISYVF